VAATNKRKESRSLGFSMYGASLAASRDSLIAMDRKMEGPISQQLALFAYLKNPSAPQFRTPNVSFCKPDHLKVVRDIWWRSSKIEARVHGIIC
jgi:hypothetical protein